ncbi:MAG TPA: hypothetical protein VGC72_07235 [Candidatus Elarobacter sp.]|jgi:hypothetical protein
MNALAPYEGASPARVDGNVVQFAAGGVAADVRVERVDRRKRASWYAIRLASTDADVTGRLLGVHRNGEITDLGGVAVAPGSIGSARLAVIAPRTNTYRSMFLEIRSENVMVRVDAPVPPSPRPAFRPWKAGVALVGAGAVAMCGGLVALALPRDPMLVPPAHAIAGTQVRLPYAAGGDGFAEYAASSDDGRVLAAGNLTRRNGEIAFALPPSAASHRVSVALSVRGPLGVVSRTASFAVAAHEPVAAAAVARVMSFSARRDPGATGDTILASYLAIGERGTVALLDAAGKVVVSSPFAHVGTNRLAVPRAYQAQPLTARITVHRGTTVADASVAIAANAQPLPSASPDAQASPGPASLADAPEAVTPIDAMSARTSGGTIAIVGHAVAGHPLHLHVAASSSPMQVELQDESGGTLAEKTIAPRATSAILPLPPATSPTTYFVALHYARNGGEETVVRTVVAAAR